MRSLCVFDSRYECWQLCYDRCHFPLALLPLSSFVLFYSSEAYNSASEETMKQFGCVPHQRPTSCIKVNQNTRCKYLIFGLYQPPQTPLEIHHLCPLPAISTRHLNLSSAISSLHLLSPAFLSDIPCKSSFLSLSNYRLFVLRWKPNVLLTQLISIIV